MTKPLDPNSQGSTNALLEDINHKFDVVLEVTQPIPDMQRTINATFEEVGKLRIDVDGLTNAFQEVNAR